MASLNPLKETQKLTAVDYDFFGSAYLKVEGDRRRGTDPNRWLNSFQSRSAHAPDIRVQFKPVEIPENRLFLSREASVSPDGQRLYWISRRGERANFQLNLEERPTVQITVEPGSPAVPFFKSFIELVGLNRGAVSLHASGFGLNGKGVVIAGLPLSGKTTVSLSVVRQGAEFLGDDWMILKEEDNTPIVCGIPRRLDLTGRMLQHLGPSGPSLSLLDRMKVTADKFLEALPVPDHQSSPVSSLARSVRQRLRVSVNPSWTAPSYAPRPLRELFITFRGTCSEISIRPISPEEAVEQLLALADQERNKFFRLLSLWGVFLPGIGPLVRNCLEIERKSLGSLLRQTRCYVLLHHPKEPYSNLAEQVLKRLST